MRTNPFSDAWIFLIGRTDEHAASGISWLLTGLFYRQPEEWPWLYVFLIFVQGLFVTTNAGKSLGLDAVIARKPFGPFAGNGLLARMYR
jgi:hypothetical protein